MNVLSVLSILMAAGVFLAAVLTSTENPMAMVDPHGALIVLGGSISATAISFELPTVFLMMKIFWRRTIQGIRPDYVKTIKHLMGIAEAYRNESSDLKTLIEQSKDPFLIEGMTALLDNLVDPKEVVRMLRTRVQTMHKRYSSDANKFKSMGKYPPAMGLMGAVLGMIALLGSLGKPGAEASIGPAMSIALIATFYGIAVANLVIIPIGENLADSASELRIKNNIIVEAINLIAQKTNSTVLAEELNSYLLPKERIDWKTLK